MNLTLFALLVYQLPEGILMAYASVGLFTHARPGWQRVLAGVAYALFIPGIRVLLPDGNHIPALAAIFFVILLWSLKLTPLVAILASVFAFLAIMAGDALVLTPLMHLMQVTPSEVFGLGFRGLLLAWSALLPLAILALFVGFGKAGGLLADESAVRNRYSL